LGIAQELEAQMQHIVDSYECEWKLAVEKQDSRKRFRQFVNSDKTDPNIVFVEERDQIRPARADEKIIASDALSEDEHAETELV
jgi:nitrite reductase (NADH) large subunit